MRHLILIRHANTQPTPDLANKDWQVTEEGRTRTEQLAQILRDLKVQSLYTSEYQKTVVTANILASAWGIEITDSLAAFNENDRSVNAPFFDSRADFVAAIQRFFDQPSELVYGGETAFDVRGRFAGGVYEILDESPNGNVAIVTHGVAMALFVATCAGQDAFETWQQIQTLGMPCYAVLQLPDLALIELKSL